MESFFLSLLLTRIRSTLVASNIKYNQTISRDQVHDSSGRLLKIWLHTILVSIFKAHKKVEITKVENQRENDIRKMNRITNQFLLTNTYQFHQTGAMRAKSTEVLNANRFPRVWALAYRARHQHLINRQKLVLQTSHEVRQAISYIILECLTIRAKHTGRVRPACIRREALQAPKWISLTLATVKEIDEHSVKQVIPVRAAPIVLATRVPLPKGTGQPVSINGMAGKLEIVLARLRERCNGIQLGELGRKLLSTCQASFIQTLNSRP